MERYDAIAKNEDMLRAPTQGHSRGRPDRGSCPQAHSAPSRPASGASNIGIGKVLGTPQPKRLRTSYHSAERKTMMEKSLRSKNADEMQAKGREQKQQTCNGVAIFQMIAAVRIALSHMNALDRERNW